MSAEGTFIPGEHYETLAKHGLAHVTRGGTGYYLSQEELDSLDVSTLDEKSVSHLVFSKGGEEALYKVIEGLRTQRAIEELESLVDRIDGCWNRETIRRRVEELKNN